MLVSLRDISLSHGVQPLLDGVDFGIDAGERLALVGRNGSGKSTLLRILAGEVSPDAGHIEQRPGLRIARLEQDLPHSLTGTVYDVVADGLGDVGRLLARYHSLTLALATDAQATDALADTQAALDAADGWNLAVRVDAAVSRAGLPAATDFATLSGGQKRRVLLARAWVRQPDVLLLDEPTNHLDIEAVTRLEESLLAWPGALLFVTHDRAFLRRLATRIVELDRGRLGNWPGDYEAYLNGKAKALAHEQRSNALFDKRLAREEVWIRQGIKARRTRNEGRVRALQAMRAERRARRERQGGAKLTAANTERSGRRAVVAEDVAYAWGDTRIVQNLSTVILRGDKVGIIGPNGSGKTTLLRLLLGELAADHGSVRHGTGLKIAHFDQHRAALDPDATAVDNVGGGRSVVFVNGREQHVMSYLQDFLFAPARARAPVRVLSGGERNRLLLAKLFTRGANLLVMDEPTNDLDVETLELLEEWLVQFAGTLLLVPHDRAFLDNVVTSTLVFEGDGTVAEYVGGYSDWLRQPRPPTPAVAPSTRPVRNTRPKPQATLTGDQRRELRSLPARIEQLERRVKSLQAVFAQPGFYERAPADIRAASERLGAAEKELASAYRRWERLENAVS